MPECYRFIVSGRVQGVYFRQSTVERATALGLRGWVRNQPDGRVEGLAAGDGAALLELRRWLQHGPPAARVDAVDWQASPESPELPGGGFEQRR